MEIMIKLFLLEGMMRKSTGIESTIDNIPSMYSMYVIKSMRSHTLCADGQAVQIILLFPTIEDYSML